MADIDFIEDTGAFSYRSAAIASDESGVYFIDPCFRTPPEPQVYKLVHLPRDTGEP
jgi:hypothetical protein